MFGKLECQNFKGAELEEYANQVGRTVEKLVLNQQRAASMEKAFAFWGIKDNKAGFEKLTELISAGLSGAEVSRSTNSYGTTIKREIQLIFTAGEKKGQSAGTLWVDYFYKDGNLNAVPEISSMIPKTSENIK